MRRMRRARAFGESLFEKSSAKTFNALGSNYGEVTLRFCTQNLNLLALSVLQQC